MAKFTKFKNNQSNMKPFYILALFCLLSVFAQAQKVYAVDYANQAELKVFVGFKLNYFCVGYL
jgi:hypothetical protein